MKYKVAIEETFCKTIEVEAESAGLAVCIVEDEYNEGRHKPSSDDLQVWISHYPHRMKRLNAP